MRKEITNIVRHVQPFMNAGKIMITIPELLEYVGKDIQFDIVNIKIVNEVN